MVKRLCFIIICFFIIGYFTNNILSIIKDDNYLHGTVIEITDNQYNENSMQQIQEVSVRLDDDGGYKNKIISITNIANLEYVYNVIVKPSDEVIVYVDDDDKNFKNCRIYSFARDKYLFYLIALFSFVIILIGGKKGLLSLISLALTMALIFLLFFPLILNGISPVLAAIAVCIVSTIITLLSIGGYKEKTYSAIIGTLGGVLFSILLTYIFGAIIQIQGTQGENMDLINYSEQGELLT